MFDLINELIPDKIKTIFYMLLYFFLSNIINYNFTYTTVLEYVIGIILVTILMLFTDFIIRQFAYKLTKLTFPKIHYDIAEMKACHWSFRVLALLIIIPIVSFTPIPDMIISYWIPSIANITKSVFENWQTEFSNQIIDALSF